MASEHLVEFAPWGRLCRYPISVCAYTTLRVHRSVCFNGHSRPLGIDRVSNVRSQSHLKGAKSYTTRVGSRTRTDPNPEDRMTKNPLKANAAQKSVQTTEKKWGKKVVGLGFCIVPSLLLKAQRRIGLNPSQLAVLSLRSTKERKKKRSRHGRINPTGTWIPGAIPEFPGARHDGFRVRTARA